jgi:hypothetical protein
MSIAKIATVAGVSINRGPCGGAFFVPVERKGDEKLPCKIMAGYGI